MTVATSPPQQHPHREVQDGPHAMWMDNYSKNLAWHLPEVGKGVFYSGLWCGFAARACTANISMRLIRDGNGNHIPAMPVDPFENRAHIQVSLLSSTFGRPNPHQRFDSSLVFQWNVTNVPLRPVVQEGMRQEFIDGLNRRADSLDNLHPMRLIDINPGQNIGFARVMKLLSEENNWDGKVDEPACSKYTAMFMDCDLFDKCVKVRTCCNTPFILAVARTMTKSLSIMCVIVTDVLRRLRRRQELPHALRGFPGLVAHLQTCCL